MAVRTRWVMPASAAHPAAFESASRSCASNGNTSAARFSLSTLVVLIETPSRLHAETTREDHPLEERRRSPRGVTELLEERVRHVQVDVESGVVDELERSHGVPQAELHRVVDILGGRDALLERADRLEHDRDHQPVHDEPRRVLADDGRVTEAGYERAQRLHRGVARRDRLDHLDELHHDRRVEEMEAGEPVGPLRRRGDLDDREAGGVRREDRRRGAHLVELPEDLFLRVHDLDDRFDDEVAVLEVRERGRAADAATGLLRIVVGDLAGLHDAGERRLDTREALLDELLIDLAREDVETGHSAHLRDAGAHLSEAHDPDALDGHGVRPSCWRLEWARTAYRDARYHRPTCLPSAVPTLSTYPSRSTARERPRTCRRTARCSSCCAALWVSPERSSCAMRETAARARCSSTTARSTPASRSRSRARANA